MTFKVGQGGKKGRRAPILWYAKEITWDEYSEHIRDIGRQIFNNTYDPTINGILVVKKIIGWAIENNLPIPLDEANLVEAKLRFL